MINAHFSLWGLRTEWLLQDKVCSDHCQTQIKAVDRDHDLNSHPLLPSPCGTDFLHMPASSHPQIMLCSSLCVSEGRTGLHKVTPTSTLYRWKLRKCHRKEHFLLQTWGGVRREQQLLPQHSLLLPHSLCFLSCLPSPFVMQRIVCKVELKRKKGTKSTSEPLCYPGRVWVVLLRAMFSSVLTGSTLPQPNKYATAKQIPHSKMLGRTTHK